MKLVIFVSFVFSALSATASYLPEKCQDLAAQVEAEVVSTAVNDLAQNQSECTFKVQVNYGTSEVDQVCPIDLYDVEQATYVDSACSVEVGQKFNHTTNHYFSTRDMKSPGLFTWINLGGYESHIVFPNYNK